MIVKRIVPILTDLQALKDDSGVKGKIDATALYESCRCAKFLATLLVFCDIMLIVDALCLYLQHQDVDITAVDTIKDAVSRIRQLVAAPGHHELQLSTVFDKITVEHQVRPGRGMATVQLTLDAWKREIRDKMITNVAAEIDGRFPSLSILGAYNELFNPLNMLGSNAPGFDLWGEESLTVITAYLEKARTAYQNTAEEIVRSKWQGKPEPPDMLEKVAEARRAASTRTLPSFARNHDAHGFPAPGFRAVDFDQAKQEWSAFKLYMHQVLLRLQAQKKPISADEDEASLKVVRSELSRVDCSSDDNESGESSADDSAEDDGNVRPPSYAVEDLTARKGVKKEGTLTWFFRVKWKGYLKQTWETEENFLGEFPKQLIQFFDRAYPREVPAAPGKKPTFQTKEIQWSAAEALFSERRRQESARVEAVEAENEESGVVDLTEFLENDNMAGANACRVRPRAVDGIIPVTISDILQAMYLEPVTRSMYPNMLTLMTIAVVISQTTVDCERGFSHLNLLFTELRSRLTEESVDQLLRISVSGPALRQLPGDFLSNSFERWNAQKLRRSDFCASKAPIPLTEEEKEDRRIRVEEQAARQAVTEKKVQSSIKTYFNQPPVAELERERDIISSSSIIIRSSSIIIIISSSISVIISISSSSSRRWGE